MFRALHLQRFGLLLASLLLVVALGEVVARVFWLQLVGVSLERPEPVLPEGVSLEDLPRLEAISELNEPNQRGIHNGVYYRTNSMRMRGPEISLQPEAGVLRIAVVGDSVAMGSGVPEEAAYAARIGPLLEAARPALRVEVVNAGMSGLDAQRIMGRRDFVDRVYHPHVIVYGFTLNDIESADYERITTAERTAGFWNFARRGAQSSSRLWSLVWLRAITVASANAPWLQAYRAEALHNYRDNRRARATLFGYLNHFAKRQGNPQPCGLLFIHTQLDQLDEAHPFLELYAAVERMGVKLKVPVVQSFPIFRGKRAETLWVAPFDPHPNEEGHALLAESLVEGLLDLPEACLRPQ